MSQSIVAGRGADAALAKVKYLAACNTLAFRDLGVPRDVTSLSLSLRRLVACWQVPSS